MTSAKITSSAEPLYPFLSPSPVYILAFLLAAVDKKYESKDLLQQYLSSENNASFSWSVEIKNKLFQKLNNIDITNNT